MPDLIAQGSEAQQCWRRSLPDGEPIVLGRLGGPWAVPWDPQVSRRHVELVWDGNRLEVARLADALNPLFLHGREVDRCTLAPGEHFVIGQTTFTLADQQANVTADVPDPMQQQSFSAQYLKQVQFRNPDHRIEVLSRLPDVISGATDDRELFVRLVNMFWPACCGPMPPRSWRSKRVAGGGWRVVGGGMSDVQEVPVPLPSPSARLPAVDERNNAFPPPATRHPHLVSSIGINGWC